MSNEQGVPTNIFPQTYLVNQDGQVAAKEDSLQQSSSPAAAHTVMRWHEGHWASTRSTSALRGRVSGFVCCGREGVVSVSWGKGVREAVRGRK
jgi:hypothetical protein